MNYRKIMLFAVCMVMLSLMGAYAFNDPVDRKGTLTVQIKGPEEITALETPVSWEVELKNDGVALASGLLHIDVIDAWRIEGKTVQPFSVAPGKTVSIPFSAIAGKRNLQCLVSHPCLCQV